MNNLFVVFVVQVVLWILLFIAIIYLVKKNTKLKKEVEAIKETWGKRKRGS